MADWQTQSSELVYETAWMRVRRDKVINHHGESLVYSVVETHHPSVFIVALNEAGEVLMQRNWRYTVGRSMWEMPAGHSEGEELLTAARRELLEETGLESDSWAALGGAFQADGIANLRCECRVRAACAWGSLGRQYDNHCCAPPQTWSQRRSSCSRG